MGRSGWRVDWREPGEVRVKPNVESISAITLATHDMGRAVSFYLALGFPLRYGGADADFSSFRVGTGYLNLTLVSEQRRWSWWGRAILYVSDVDALYRQALAAGLQPQ